MTTFGHFMARVVSDWTHVLLQTGLELEEGLPPITTQVDFLLRHTMVMTKPFDPPFLFYSCFQWFSWSHTSGCPLEIPDD